MYRGTATGRDNGSILGDGVPDGELSGAVVASLIHSENVMIDDLVGSAHLLRIASAAQKKGVRVGQAGAGPGIGHVPPIEGLHSFGGVSGQTETVLPAFGPRPDVLAFRAHAEGSFTTGERLVVDLDVSLTRVPPAMLTFLDLDPLDHNLGLERFASVGPEHVRSIRDLLSERGCPPEGSGFLPDECTYRVVYRATEFVKTAELTSYGIRDIVIDSAELCCYHCDQPMHHGCVSGARMECY